MLRDAHASAPADGVAWHPEHTVGLTYLARFRTAADRAAVSALFLRVFGVAPTPQAPPRVTFTPTAVVVGEACVARAEVGPALGSPTPNLPVLHGLAASLERVALCAELAWPCMLVGPSSSGAEHRRACPACALRRPGQYIREVPPSSPFPFHPHRTPSLP